ncbi:MAG: DsbA family oxidoreductase, partial [Pseudomonadota bacterium]
MSVTLDILSDPICPWCYIGKARLESALGKRAAAEAPVALDLQWRPFQLNPEMPADGMDRRAYLEAKFGGKEGAVRVYSAIQSAAEEDGLEIAFDKIERTPNTIDAHRLIRWARIDNAQNAVVDALFRRYFVEGDDISNPEVLTETAIAAG